MFKKSALALALAAASTAWAQSPVEIYGKIGVYHGTDRQGTGPTITKQFDDYSRIGFRGQEDLGGGLKLNFALETSINADAPNTTNTRLGDRRAHVGLSNALGGVILGRQPHNINQTLIKYDVFEWDFASVVDSVHSPQGYRLSNAATVFATPVKGVRVHYTHAASEQEGVSAAQTGGVEAEFGAFRTAITRYDNGTNTTNMVAAAYDIRATGTTISGIYSDNRVDGVEYQGRSIGVKQRLGTTPLSVLASYATRDTVDAYNVGAEYAFSKRTALHIRYREDHADDNTNDRRQFGVGLTHNF